MCVCVCARARVLADAHVCVRMQALYLSHHCVFHICVMRCVNQNDVETLTVSIQRSTQGPRCRCAHSGSAVFPDAAHA
jgi:hypothetical protein